MNNVNSKSIGFQQTSMCEVLLSVLYGPLVSNI
jgi:hypothetical protein